METHLRRIACGFVFLSILLSVHAEDPPPFPHISDIEIEFYETEVQITDLNQPSTGMAKEIYDDSVPRGVVDLLIFGNRQSIYYNNDTFEILQVNETTCEAMDEDMSIYDTVPIFYGWLNEDPLIIGPSAPLWYANTRRKHIEYKGTEVVRNIKCDVYTLPRHSSTEEIIFTFYFADKEWTTPYQLPGMRVPIRITVNGTSAKESGDPENPLPINLISDFGYFRPTVSNWFALDPPMGIGCPFRKTTRTPPSMPDTFRYKAEVFDVLQTDPNNKLDTYEIDFQQVWYERERKIARLDQYNRKRYLSEIYDFNTGVKYSKKDGETCQIKSLRNSMFEEVTTSLIGRFKLPEEVLKLDGDFYYMGERRMRGIWCDTYEWADHDVSYNDETYHKLVISIYYAKGDYMVVIDGEKDDIQVPLHYVVTGYSTPDNVTLKLQYNIFEFDDVIWPDMYENFGVEMCFPEPKDKAYVIMIMGVGEDLARKMEGSHEMMMLELRSQITQYAKISDMRLPLLTADYKSMGVFATGLILDRPPALAQFFFEDTNALDIHDDHVAVAIDADTKEKCAYSCIDNKNMVNDVTCKGFHFCGKSTCILRSKDLTEPYKGNNTFIVGQDCEIWWKSVGETNNDEPYLKTALQSLTDAVVEQKVKLDLKVVLGKDIGDKEIPVDDIIIDGSSDGLADAKEYELVCKSAKLDEEEKTTVRMHDVSSIDDCFDLCKNSDALACATFSFCPDLEDHKACMLTSTMFTEDLIKGPNRIEVKKCNIYTIKYLSFFDAYPGRVALTSADELYKNIPRVEECARKCREDKTELCRGFEYCRATKTCALHNTHYLDLNKTSFISGVNDKITCTHYAAKFMTDYSDLGYTLLDDNTDVRADLTVEECAKICSEELRTSCKSFNYCPKTEVYNTDSSCALSSKLLTDDRVTTTTKSKCHHYEKRASVKDWKKIVKKSVSTSGYTSKGFTGLVIGMLALGLILGAIGFVGYSYYRSRAHGDGMTVRFVKQPA